MVSEKYASSTADVVLSGFTEPYTMSDELLQESLRVLKPKGILAIREPFVKSNSSSSHGVKIQLNGFLLQTEELEEDKSICRVVAEKPSYEVCQ